MAINASAKKPFDPNKKRQCIRCAFRHRAGSPCAPLCTNCGVRHTAVCFKSCRNCGGGHPIWECRWAPYEALHTTVVAHYGLELLGLYRLSRANGGFQRVDSLHSVVEQQKRLVRQTTDAQFNRSNEDMEMEEKKEEKKEKPGSAPEGKEWLTNSIPSAATTVILACRLGVPRYKYTVTFHSFTGIHTHLISHHDGYNHTWDCKMENHVESFKSRCCHTSGLSASRHFYPNASPWTGNAVRTAIQIERPEQSHHSRLMPC